MQTEAPGRPPASPRRRRGARSLLKAALTAAAATLVFGLTAASASAAPALDVSKTSDLRSGMTVQVSGTDFLPPTPPTDSPALGNPGMYVVVIAETDGQTVFWPANSGAWVRYTDGGGNGGDFILNPTTGEFPAVSVTVNAKRFDGDGNVTVDCRETQCYMGAIQARTTVNPAVYAKVPLEFSDHGLMLDPRAGLNPSSPNLVRVAGQRFDEADSPDGYRVAQAQSIGGQYRYGPSILAKSGADPDDPAEVELNANGTFFADLSVSASLNGTGGPINCALLSCSVIAWPAGEEPTGGQSTNVLANEGVSFAFTYNPVVKLSQRTNLGENADVTVEGAGFPARQPGLYVTQAVMIGGEYHTAKRDTSGTATNMKFVMPNSTTADTLLKPDGSFTTAISVTRELTLDSGQKVNCVVQDCRVITWVAHTDPSRDTLFTSSPLVFKEDPPVVAPRINVVKRKQIRVGRSGKALTLAGIRCGSENCTVHKPNRVLLRVGKQNFRLALAGPRKAADGNRAQLRLRLTGKAAKALVGRRARVRFRVVVRSESGNQSAVINRVLVGARKVNRR